MASYKIYRETATTEGLVIEGTTFSGTPEALHKHTRKLITEGNDRTRLHITVVAFDKLQTKVAVLVRRQNAIVPPSKDVLASLPTAEDYAQVARAPRLVVPSIQELLES